MARALTDPSPASKSLPATRRPSLVEEPGPQTLEAPQEPRWASEAQRNSFAADAAGLPSPAAAAAVEGSPAPDASASCLEHSSDRSEQQKYEGGEYF